jgi:hypothetical protein
MGYTLLHFTAPPPRWAAAGRKNVSVSLFFDKKNMSVAYGKAFVGRTVKINAEYFEDVSSVDVDSDF